MYGRSLAVFRNGRVRHSVQGRLAWIGYFGGEYIGKRGEAEEDTERQHQWFELRKEMTRILIFL